MRDGGQFPAAAGPGETVRLAIDFAHDYPGSQTHVFHSYNLEHEDAGMMINFRAMTGPHARIRHPQYAFGLILLGFLLQRPTLLTLVMFPILLVMYARLAITEEAEMLKQFGAEFDAYAASTPRFLPSWRIDTKRPAH